MVRRIALLLTLLVIADVSAAQARKAPSRSKGRRAKAKKAPAPAPVVDTTAHAYLRAVTGNDRVAQGKILAAGRRGYVATDGSRIVVFPDKSGVRVRRDGSKSFAGVDVTGEVKGLEPAALVSSI